LDSEKIYNYFHSNFELSNSSNGWYRMNNPMSRRSIEKDDKCMGINFTYQRVKCHRTGYKSSIVDFLRILTNKTYREIKKSLESYEKLEFKISKIHIHDNTLAVNLPDNFYLLNERVPLQERALSYLVEDRKLDYDLLISRSIGFCNKGKFFGRIIIPFMNPTLQYYTGRSFIGSEPKYDNPRKEDVGIGKSEIFYNEEQLKQNEAILVEGAIDALTCGELGIASSGWSLSDTQISKIIKSPLKDLYVIPDKGFFNKAVTTGRLFLDHKNVYITNLDKADGNDVNQIGINDIKFKKLGWTTTY